MEAHGYLPYYLSVKSMVAACDVGFLPLDDYIFCKSPTPAGLTSLKILHVDRHGQ